MGNWVVGYRYSQLERLHQIVKQRHRNVPAFPSKSLFKNKISVVAQRKHDLQRKISYLELLLLRFPQQFDSLSRHSKRRTNLAVPALYL